METFTLALSLFERPLPTPPDRERRQTRICTQPMTTRQLQAINAILFVAVVAGALFYLCSSDRRPPTSGELKTTSDTREPGGKLTGAQSATTGNMAPSERFLSDAEWERQNKMDAELQQQQSADAEQTMVRWPLAMLEPDAEMALEPLQMAVLERLRQTFKMAMTGTGKDPSSPEYREQWVAAQTAFDDQLQVLLGDEAFIKFNQMAAKVVSAPEHGR